jgi:glycosyltransferase involved in cell wall biosynthesis
MVDLFPPLMKILELTDFSAGTCGVWTRAKQEAELLSQKRHIVKAFSSNFTKGTNKLASKKEKLGKIEIQRFSALMPGKKPLHFLPGGESYMFWNFKEAMKEIKKYKPNVIIAHSYSHPHTLFALRAAKLTRAKVFLVTHAPFVEGDITRSFWGHSARWFFDFFIGRNTINKFDKIIAITKWEIPYLEKLGVKKEKIVYIPNGIPDKFFEQKSKTKEENKVLFLGRISPIKDLEVLIKSIPLIEDKNTQFEIVGPAEEDYLNKLKSLVNSLGIGNRLFFSKPIYELDEKIKKIDSAKIFVLPSKREAMPQALIEAMSRGKIVISSDNPGSREIISNGKNGFLFPVGDEKTLAKLLDNLLNNNNQNLNKIRKSAIDSVREFNWSKVIKRLEEVISLS